MSARGHIFPESSRSSCSSRSSTLLHSHHVLQAWCLQVLSILHSRRCMLSSSVSSVLGAGQRGTERVRVCGRKRSRGSSPFARPQVGPWAQPAPTPGCQPEGLLQTTQGHPGGGPGAPPPAPLLSAPAYKQGHGGLAVFWRRPHTAGGNLFKQSNTKLQVHDEVGKSRCDLYSKQEITTN